MSGTSADGIDAALVEIRDEGARLQVDLAHFLSVPYPDETRRLVFRAFADTATTSTLCSLNAILGALFAEAAAAVASSAGVPMERIRCIGSHGQTVWHEPAGAPVDGRSTRSTLQIGSPAVIAERTGCTVVADFRSRDMAAGGQGAPLIPHFDWLMLTHPSRSRAVQNIGGIGNVTYLPAGASLEQVIAFDTGPGNALIDAAVERVTGGRQKQDTDGRIAASGEARQDVLDDMLAHPYFTMPPPKSTGRELFGATFMADYWARLPRSEDLVATLTEFTAASIADAYSRWVVTRGPLDEVIVGGGGSYNPTLVSRLRERLAPARVLAHEDVGIRGDAKEAMAFAVLAYETMRGRPGNVPSATGALRPVVLGSVTPGSNPPDAMGEGG